MKKILSLALALIMVLTVVTCASAEAAKKYSFAFLPNTQNNTFQSTMNDTFRQLCEENGYDYVCLDPDYDVNIQLNQLNDVANKKLDAAFVIPVDSAGIRQGRGTLHAWRASAVRIFASSRSAVVCATLSRT